MARHGTPAATLPAPDFPRIHPGPSVAGTPVPSPGGRGCPSPRGVAPRGTSARGSRARDFTTSAVEAGRDD